MSSKLLVGETVHVPYSKFDPLFLERRSPFFETSVTEIKGRTVRVLLPDGEESEFILSSLVQKNIGILIIEIGDFYSETLLLNPLAKSILQSCRLLMGDDEIVRFEKCRSLAEFKIIWHDNAKTRKYIILIGHGTNDSMIFGIDKQIKANIIREIISVDDSLSKSIISLCCKTGQRYFAQVLSNCNNVESFVGPYHTVHGAIASQFTQTYLSNHLLTGITDRKAFKKAVSALPSKTIFKFWEKGKLQI